MSVPYNTNYPPTTAGGYGQQYTYGFAEGPPSVPAAAAQAYPPAGAYTPNPQPPNSYGYGGTYQVYPDSSSSLPASVAAPPLPTMSSPADAAPSPTPTTTANTTTIPMTTTATVPAGTEQKGHVNFNLSSALLHGEGQNKNQGKSLHDNNDDNNNNNNKVVGQLASIPNGTNVYFCLVMSNPFFSTEAEKEERNRNRNKNSNNGNQTLAGGADGEFFSPDDALGATTAAVSPSLQMSSVVTDEDYRAFRPSARIAHTDESLLEIDRSKATKAELERAVVESIWRLRNRGLTVEPADILVKVPVPKEDFPWHRARGEGRGRGGGGRGQGSGDGAGTEEREPRRGRGGLKWEPRYPLYVLDNGTGRMGSRGSSPTKGDTNNNHHDKHRGARETTGGLLESPSSPFGYDNEGDALVNGGDGSSGFDYRSQSRYGAPAGPHPHRPHQQRRHAREAGHHYFRLNKNALLTSKPGKHYGKRLFIKVTGSRDVLLNYAESAELSLRTHPLSDAGGAVWEYDKEYDGDFTRSVEVNKRLLRAERLTKERRDPSFAQKHALREQEDAYKRGGAHHDPIGYMKGCEGFIFRAPEKFRTIEMIVRDPFVFGGCGLQVREMASSGSFVEDFFPLHDPEELKRHGLLSWCSYRNILLFTVANVVPLCIRERLKSRSSAKTTAAGIGSPSTDEPLAFTESGAAVNEDQLSPPYASPSTGSKTAAGGHQGEEEGTPLLWHRNYVETHHEAILSYFGEQVALYFLWLHHIIAFLPILALAGIVCAILPLITSEIPEGLTYFIFGVVSVWWAAMWLLRWRRTEEEFNIMYQQEELTHNEIIRDEYDSGSKEGESLKLADVLRLNNIDIPFIYRRSGAAETERSRLEKEQVEMEEAMSASFASSPDAANKLGGSVNKLSATAATTTAVELEVEESVEFVRFRDLRAGRRKCLQIIGSFLVLVMTCAYVALVTYLTWWRYEDVNNDVVSYASSILGAIGGAFISFVFDYVVSITNSLENYPTEQALESATIQKNFFYSFFAFYYSMFIIALYPTAASNEERLGALKVQMIIICVAKPLVQNFTEVMTPIMMRWWNNVECCCGTGLGRNTDGEDEEEGVAQVDATALVQEMRCQLQQQHHQQQAMSQPSQSTAVVASNNTRNAIEMAPVTACPPAQYGQQGQGQQQSLPIGLGYQAGMPPPMYTQPQYASPDLGNASAAASPASTMAVGLLGGYGNNPQTSPASPPSTNQYEHPYYHNPFGQNTVANHGSPNGRAGYPHQQHQNLPHAASVYSAQSCTTVPPTSSLVTTTHYQPNNGNVNHPNNNNNNEDGGMSLEEKRLAQRIRDAVDLKNQSNYAKYATVTVDYMEIVLQFGFMIMFASTFPWAPLCALFYNIIEVKIDAYRHVRIMQRPVPQPAHGIGHWKAITGILVGLAIVTNAFFICVLSSAPAAVKIKITDSNSWNWKLFIALQYAMVAIIWVMWFYYGGKSHEARQMETKMAFLARRLRFKTSLEKANSKKNADH